MTVEDFNRLFAENFRAPYFLVQQLLPVLRDGSNVIFVSSLVARSAAGTIATYAATKGVVDTLVKHFAAALGPRGTRANAIAPGVVDAEMSSFAYTESGRQLTLSMQALKAIAERASGTSFVRRACRKDRSPTISPAKKRLLRKWRIAWGITSAWWSPMTSHSR
jgi:NAD(P)-dependent dehydrogenase (short-subunit alcohol dehydrogenase family)